VLVVVYAPFIVTVFDLRTYERLGESGGALLGSHDVYKVALYGEHIAVATGTDIRIFNIVLCKTHPRGTNVQLELLQTFYFKDMRKDEDGRSLRWEFPMPVTYLQMTPHVVVAMRQVLCPLFLPFYLFTHILFSM
jgi:hypothetical protein